MTLGHAGEESRLEGATMPVRNRRASREEVSSNHVTSNRPCEIAPPPGVQNIILLNMTIYRQDDRAAGIQVAGPVPPPNSTFAFGTTAVGDVPMTVTPDPHSKEIARLRGTFFGVSKSDPNNTRSYMTHISFIRGKYKGSSLSILGISNYFDLMRERPIVGGNRKLRLASGYIEARDISDNPNVEEYRICCLHYGS
ncbi:dirigent protein 22-like [Rutidosis leptorrhynchoides]|uniref:dirigent protein 22-like n=1 Tax=Rutidosis leptorrhynchoides TaxID=125765 RepID=UPI003A999B5E